MAGFIEYEIQLIPRYLYYEAKEDDEYKRNELTYFFSCLLLLAAIAREMCMLSAAGRILELLSSPGIG